jgi:hypothetical protein
MARKQTTTEPKPANVDPHAGMGGSYRNAGGVNHDIEQEPARELVERTEHRVVRSVEQEEQAAAEKSGE